MTTIGFYLNLLINKKYNIHIIISYIATKKNQFTVSERYKIWRTIQNSDYFIYQKHNNNFGIKASNIHKFANKVKILIPNLQLYYTDLYGKPIELDKLKETFAKSYEISKKNIQCSDFNNFMFVLDNFRNIRFFDTPTHPTLYLLYLLSLQIHSKMIGNAYNFKLDDYYLHKNDDTFLQGETVTLCSSWPYKIEECEAININLNSEYYSLPKNK